MKKFVSIFVSTLPVNPSPILSDAIYFVNDVVYRLESRLAARRYPKPLNLSACLTCSHF
jgi:hypothetical protein